MTTPGLSSGAADVLASIPAPLAAVVALARRHGSDDYPFASSGFRRTEFQRAFFAHAERLSVLGLTLVELSRSGRLGELAPDSGVDAASHLRLLRRQAMMWDLERESVVWRLDRAGIPVVLLKGAALRMSAYRDPAERSFGDIDVLVPRESIPAAVSALTAGGYEPESERRITLYLEHHHHLILTKPEGFVVEVHWALDAPASPFQLDPAAFFRDARAVPNSSATTFHIPSPEHMVLHLAHQNLENGFSQLRRIVDVDRVIASEAGFDWIRLESEAKRMRVHAVLGLTLRLAELLLETAVPAGFIEGLGLTPAARKHLALLDPVGLVLRQRGNRRAIRDLVMFWCLPDLRTRLSALKEMGTGERTLWWRRLGPGVARGGGDGVATRLAAIFKMTAYQGAIYPIDLLGLGRSGKSAIAFWGRPLPSR